MPPAANLWPNRVHSAQKFGTGAVPSKRRVYVAWRRARSVGTPPLQAPSPIVESNYFVAFFKRASCRAAYRCGGRSRARAGRPGVPLECVPVPPTSSGTGRRTRLRGRTCRSWQPSRDLCPRPGAGGRHRLRAWCNLRVVDRQAGPRPAIQACGYSSGVPVHATTRRLHDIRGTGIRDAVAAGRQPLPAALAGLNAPPLPMPKRSNAAAPGPPSPRPASLEGTHGLFDAGSSLHVRS